MNGWIYGEHSVIKISSLKAAFAQKRIRDAEAHFDVRGLSYSPLFSQKSNYQEVSSHEVRELLKKPSLENYNEVLPLKERFYLKIPTVQNSDHIKAGCRFCPDDGQQMELILSEFDEALQHLKVAVPWMHQQYIATIDETMPLIKSGSLRSDSGLSDFRLIGCIFMSLRPAPNSMLKLVVSLAHELSHHILFLYQSGQDPFLEPYRSTDVYSSIRTRDRPIYASFQGCMAFAFMLLALEGLEKSQSMKVDLGYCRELSANFQTGLISGLRSFNQKMFSPIGHEIYRDLTSISGKNT